MAHTIITVSNGVEIKKVPLGYSWTTLLFGGWVPLIRQDWVPGVFLFILCLITWGFAGVPASFLYNSFYAKSLFNKGYKIHALPPGYTEDMLKVELGYVKFPHEQ